MASLVNPAAAEEGIFNHIKINNTLEQVLLKLNHNATNALALPANADNGTPISVCLSFMKLTKKMKLFYLANTLNKLKNQIVKYNVKKLFQIWHVYHRENSIVNAIVDIFFKVPQYDIKSLKKDMLLKNKKGSKNKKQRDETCRAICQNGDLLRVFDRKNFRYCLDNFNVSVVQLKKKTPIIMCFDKSDIDAMVKVCLYEKNFPIHLLPCTIAKDIKRILKNKLPKLRGA